MNRLVTIAVTSLLVGGLANIQAQTAGQWEKLFEGARHAAVMDGDLRGAIAQYSRIAAEFKATPGVAARALYQRGLLEEKLRLPVARATYEQVLREYGAATQYVTASRARLVARGWLRGQSGTGIQTRLLWDNAVDLWGTTSSDGRWFSFPDWETGDLGVRDLVAGINRRVTNKGGYATAKGEAEASAMSPSGNLIAFTWDRWDAAAKEEGTFQIRVIGSNGSGERVLLGGKDLSNPEPQSWSPDEKWIAAVVPSHSAPGARIVLLAADGSQTRTVLTLAEHRPDHLRFSPDGSWLAYNTESARPGSLATPQEHELFIIRVSAPGTPTKVVSNANMIGWTPDGTGVLFGRERNTETDLYLLPVSGGLANGDAVKITSVTDVGTPVGVTSQGGLIYGKTRRTTDAAVASIDPVTGTLGSLQTVRPIAAYGLGGAGGGVRFSPDGKHVLFTDTQTTMVIQSIADGSERKLVPQMSRVGRVEWAADSTALLVSGSGSASSGPEGVYRVDTNTGAATLIFAAPAVHLFAPSPDGTVIYYRKQGGPVVAKDLATGGERTLVTAPGALFDLRLARDGSKLALVGLSKLTMVTTSSGVATVRFTHQEDSSNKFNGGEWSPDGRRFLTIVTFGPTGAGPKELWSLSEDGAEPFRQSLPGPFRGVRLNAAGTQLATVRWENILQVWTVENFLPTLPVSNQARR